MIQTHRPVRGAIALAVVVLMLGLSLGVPLLDLGWSPGELALSESEVPAGWVDHDHDLCMMYGAAPGSPSGSLEPPVQVVSIAVAAPGLAPSRAAVELHSHDQARAPPIV